MPGRRRAALTCRRRPSSRPTSACRTAVTLDQRLRRQSVRRSRASSCTPAPPARMPRSHRTSPGGRARRRQRTPDSVSGRRSTTAFTPGCFGTSVTPVDLSALSDPANGVLITGSGQSFVLINLTRGQGDDRVFAYSDTTLTTSDVQNLAQAAANRFDAGASLGGRRRNGSEACCSRSDSRRCRLSYRRRRRPPLITRPSSGLRLVPLQTAQLGPAGASLALDYGSGPIASEGRVLETPRRHHRSSARATERAASSAATPSTTATRSPAARE